MLVTQISIELSGLSRFEYVVAKQGDNGSRVIQITLTNNGKIYILDNLTIARAFIKKPDKTTVSVDCPISNNIIELVLDSNILACAGTAAVEISLTNNSTGDILTSAEFDLIIVASKISKVITDNNDTEGNSKVSLPVTADGTVDYGAAGQFAVSDGAGGVNWITVENFDMQNTIMVL